MVYAYIDTFLKIIVKHIQDFYAENCAMMMKEIKDLINGETYCVHGLEDLI